jgi:hypothetical protein
MTPLDELPSQLGAPKLDETTAAALVLLDPEKKQSRRERYLDQLHANLEADPSPKKPVHISLFPHGEARIVFCFDSLKKRKKRTPSERERRRLLGIQLADFLKAGGL